MIYVKIDIKLKILWSIRNFNDISKERKKELFELARKDLISRKNETARTSTGSTRKAFFDAAEAIANAAPGKESEPIIIEAKKIGFKEFIKDCADFERDLSELLGIKKDWK